ncbi:MAG: hypothetical protein ACLPH3_07530 [Terracidiphilus sp.]
MLFKKLSLAAAALASVLLFGTSTATAEDSTQCFDLASLQGDYAILGTYGANVALALGKRYFDGKGNLTGTFLVNEPTPDSTTGARTLVTGTQAGTYTVNCDGTGVVTRTLTVGTTVTPQIDDFVITAAIVRHGHLIATRINDAQETPSAIVAGGIFLTRVYTRLPVGPTW